MSATLTELHRETAKVLSAVLLRKQTLELTEHGKTVAEVNPRAEPLTPAEFSKLWNERSPLDKATAEEMQKNIAKSRRAECLS